MKSLISNPTLSKDLKLSTLKFSVCSFTNTFSYNSWASRLLNLFRSKSSFSSSPKLLDSNLEDGSLLVSGGGCLWGFWFWFRSEFLYSRFYDPRLSPWVGTSCFCLLLSYLVFLLTIYMTLANFKPKEWQKNTAPQKIPRSSFIENHNLTL